MPRTVVGGSAKDLLEAFATASSDNFEVVWEASDWDPTPLMEATGPLVGTVSPLPLAEAATHPTPYLVHPDLPPPPALPRPCPTFVRFTADAVQLLQPHLPADALSAAHLVEQLGASLTRLGYQHVAAPGVALQWSPGALLEPPLLDGFAAALDSAANASLEAHRLWAATRIRPIDIVLDGACITADVSTGTQRLVIEVATHLAAARLDARVSLAVPRDHQESARLALSGTGVAVVDRGSAETHDVVYRPYQMLRAQELPWFQTAGRRALVNQLDMIGFSNPTYHPSSDLFFLIRNVQRSMMLQADGVTFISEFGRRSALIEVPDLEFARTTVVSCGSDTTPLPGVAPTPAPVNPFVLVLSSTFTHKNRSHAIASFAHAVRSRGIEGSLVIAGPEPHYGGSTDEEALVVASNSSVLGSRVHYLGEVSEHEKWWLLRNASAVLYPSTVEGFGLVPFEAAAVGVPCLAFRGTALGEILGDGPSTLPTWEVGTWADALAALLTDPSAKADALAHIGAAAARHTWGATALATWDAIDRAVAMPRRVRVEHEGTFAAAVTPATRLARLLGARAFYLRLVPYLQRRVASLLRRRG